MLNDGDEIYQLHTGFLFWNCKIIYGLPVEVPTSIENDF
jgi:hypothetical protein